jgi:hypothetical protein
MDKVKLYTEWSKIDEVYTVCVYLGGVRGENQIYITQVVVSANTRRTADGTYVDSGADATDVALTRLAGRLAFLLSHGG